MFKQKMDDDSLKLYDLVNQQSKLVKESVEIIRKLHSTIEQQQEIIIDLNNNITILENRISNIESKLNIKV